MTVDRSRRTWLPLLVLILLLAGGLRIYRLDAQSFWNDEGNSARIAERSVSAIVEGAAGDIHPPGYYLMLAGWRAFAGKTEFALRFLSVIAGTLTIALVASLGRRLFDSRIGLLAAVLVAVNPFHVFYSQEARMYTLLTMLGAASMLLTVGVLTIPGEMVASRRGGSAFNGRRAAVIIGGYVLVNAMGLYTHYSFPAIILAETLASFVWLAGRKQKRHGLITWVVLQAATLFLFLPWLPVALRQIANWPRGAGDVTELIFGRTLAYGTTLPPDAARIGLIPLGFLALAGLIPPVPSRAENAYLRFGERITLVLGVLLILPILLVAGGSVSGPALKFLLPANLALLLLAARGVMVGGDLASDSMRGGRFIRLVLGLIFVLSVVPMWTGLRGLYFDPAYARDDYRAIEVRIQSERGDDAAVILNAPNQWEVFTYYYPDGPGITPLPDDTTEETLTSLIDHNDRIYALFWGAEQQDPDRVVETMLEQQSFVLSSDWYGGVRLVTYAVIGEPASEPEVITDAGFGLPPAITLTGYALSEGALAAGDALGVTLFWQTGVAIDARLKVFVHLYTEDGSLVSQHDSEPGNGLSPTDGWAPFETVVDGHGLLIPADAMPGTYTLAVGMYLPEDGQRLQVTVDGQADSDVFVLHTIEVRD